MKTSFVTLGLFASLAGFAVASPAADAVAQLEGRDPIVCIGCVNTDCTQHSTPSHCNEDSDDIIADCETFCFAVAPGCRCCDIVDGETDNDSCRAV